jgi:hypothetical protein
MKTFNLIFLFFLVLGQWSCRKETLKTSQAELIGTWELEKVVRNNTVMQKPATRQGLYDVSITFKENGELEATTVNNYLTGFYETSQQNGMLLGGDGSARTETNWGEIFVNALPDVNLYDLKPTQLVLLCSNNDKLVFKRAGLREKTLASGR